MLRNILPCLLSFGLLLASCKKGSTDDSSNQTDSLGAGWSKVDIGVGNYFIDIFFFGNTGFGTGRNNIFRSDDGGNTWNIAYQAALEITNIAMGSTDNAVFVSGEGGKIYYTNNGGDSFDSTTVVDTGIYDAFFVNENTAYALGDNVWKTKDGGHSWNLLYAFTPSTHIYKTLYFLDEMNGWASVPSGLYKTKDGGVTWEKNITSGLASGMIGAISFSDINTGYISNKNNILRTNDAGDSWKIVFSEQDLLLDIYFPSKDTGYINLRKSIYKTTNGGLSWHREVKLNEHDGVMGTIELHFTDTGHGWASGSKGAILKYIR
jgi:photosystem II stability/assembly factor-like uncharacterized protein